MSTPSETISTETSQPPEPVGEALDAPRGVGGVGGDDRRPLAGDRAEPSGQPLGVLLVDRHHEPAGVGVRASPQLDERGVRVAQHVRDPVAVGIERGAQPACGLGGRQHGREVGAPAAAVAHPLHLAAVGVEGHRPADAVEQGVRVAVAEVGLRDAVLVVRRPTGSACCRSGTACRRAAAGSARRSNAASVLRPQAASSPMWCGSSAISSVGASAQRRRCTPGPAASVA